MISNRVDFLIWYYYSKFESNDVLLHLKNDSE